MKEAYTNNPVGRPTKNLEPHKEALVALFREGTTYEHLKEWLREQGVNVSVRTIKSIFKSWCVTRRLRTEVAKPESRMQYYFFEHYADDEIVTKELESKGYYVSDSPLSLDKLAASACVSPFRRLFTMQSASDTVLVGNVSRSDELARRRMCLRLSASIFKYASGNPLTMNGVGRGGRGCIGGVGAGLSECCGSNGGVVGLAEIRRLAP